MALSVVFLNVVMLDFRFFLIEVWNNKEGSLIKSEDLVFLS